MNTETASLLDQWREKSVKKHRPLQASLELTFRCNERCTHCYLEKFWDDPKKILTLDQWKHCLDELRRAGVLYIILMGGEAMLNPLFWDIASYASRKGFHVSMITNAQLIQSADTVSRMVDVGVRNMTVSLYSLTPEIHDRMTSVRGSQVKTINGIELMLKANLRVGVNCLLTSENIEGYFEVADWCIERNIEIKSDPFVTPKLNGDIMPTKLRATESQIRNFYQNLVTKWPQGKPKPVLEESKDYVCNAAKGKCAVTPYGELLSCIEIREPLGSLTINSFEELWSGPTAMKWRSLKVGDLKNRLIGDEKNFCDHCPGMAKHESGDPMVISGYSSMVAKIRKEFSI